MIIPYKYSVVTFMMLHGPDVKNASPFKLGFHVLEAFSSVRAAFCCGAVAHQLLGFLLELLLEPWVELPLPAYVAVAVVAC